MSERETLGEIIALTNNYDGCHERIRLWESREDWEKTDPGEVATDREDAEFWNLRADSVLAAGYTKPRTPTSSKRIEAVDALFPVFTSAPDTAGDLPTMNGATIARLTCQRGEVAEFPLAEKVRGGWQNGVTFYPDEQVVSVKRLRVTEHEDDHPGCRPATEPLILMPPPPLERRRMKSDAPLRLIPESLTAASHPPSPATGADNRTTTHATPVTGAGDEGESNG